MEIFRNINWYEWLYQISNLGNLKSLNYKRLGKEKILKQQITRDWYEQIELSNNRIRKKFYVHRLVALSFINVIKDKIEVNHKDWNKLNNIVSNLEWSNRSENMKHCVNVLWKNWRKVWKYNLQWAFIKSYNSAQQASLDSNLYKSSAIKVCKWQRKTAGGFIFKFIN